VKDKNGGSKGWAQILSSIQTAQNPDLSTLQTEPGILSPAAPGGPMNTFSHTPEDVGLGARPLSTAPEVQSLAMGRMPGNIASPALDFKDQRIRRMGQAESSATGTLAREIQPSSTIWAQPKLRIRPMPRDSGLHSPVDLDVPVAGGEGSIPQLLRPLLRQWLDDNMRLMLSDALQKEDKADNESSIWKQPKSSNRGSVSTQSMHGQRDTAAEPGMPVAADLIRPLLQEWLDDHMCRILKAAAASDRSE